MKNKTWPWIILLCSCVCFALFTVFTLVLDRTNGQTQDSTSSTAPVPVDRPKVQFESHFVDPDWAALYALADISDTPFENAATFAAYMTERVGQQSLTCLEVQSELPEAHRYLVFCGTDKIAGYYLTEPYDTMGALEFYFDRTISVTVQTPPDYTVFVNGVALDDTYTVRTVQTKAENYLPEGIHGVRQRWQTVTDLLCAPKVTATDANGNPVELICDDGIYRMVENAPATITQQQIDFLTAAGIADARYAIGAIREPELSAYFDETTDLYHMLVTNPRNIQKYTSSTIEDIVVGEFVQYTDTLFSANVKLTQKIIRTSGTLKTYTMDKTYFFVQTETGEYRVVDYTNEHMTDIIETVRLTFVTEAGSSSMMIDASSYTVTTPTVEDPDAFLGWATRCVGEDGTVIYTVRILQDGTVLGKTEPMILYPVFQ